MSLLLSYSRSGGVDVSKDMLDICIMAGALEVSSRFPNTTDGIAGIAELCRKHQVEIVVTEATGGLQRPLALALIHANIPVAVINPGRIRHYAQAEGMIVKTDKVDAHIIAFFALKIAPAPTLVRTVQQEELARLAARKLQLTDYKIAEQNRLSREVDALVLKNIDRLLAFIEKELGKIDQRLDTLVKLDPKLQAKAEAADSVFSVDPVWCGFWGGWRSAVRMVPPMRKPMPVEHLCRLAWMPVRNRVLCMHRRSIPRHRPGISVDGRGIPFCGRTKCLDDRTLCFCGRCTR